MISWISPDGKITKELIRQGTWGDKPSEGSRCTITITHSPLLTVYSNTVVTVGDNECELWRALDICLTSMFVGEKSKFTLDRNTNSISLVLELVDLVFTGFIYEWDVSKKYNLALHHKELGNNLFRIKDYKGAAFRFTKGLKLLSSIPIDVEKPPVHIDGIALVDINSLKGNLLNNLSSCYFKNQLWNMVLALCSKVLLFDQANVKAFYKIGVAYKNEKNYEKAIEAFRRALELEPKNRPCAEHLTDSIAELRKIEIEVNNITKKMFNTVNKN